MTNDIISPLSVFARVLSRPRAAGKFLFVGQEKLFVRGVNYGSSEPGRDHFGDPEKVETDLKLMVQSGINVLRTRHVPPLWLLNLAATYGLRVLVSVGAGGFFTSDRDQLAALEAQVR